MALKRNEKGQFVKGYQSYTNLGKRWSKKRGHKDAWNTWKSMKERCNNPNSKAYKYYGKKGITVCKEWDSFWGFFKDMGDRPKGRSIDRINNSKGYYERNCRWATRREQMNNKTNNRNMKYQGETLSLSQWARKVKIKRTTLDMRIREYGWGIEKALNYYNNNSVS